MKEMRAGAVHHLALQVRDLARSEAFYAEVLGLPILQRWARPDGSPRSVWLSLDDASFVALEQAEGSEANGAGWSCVALRIAVEDRQAWLERLETAGHPLVRATQFTLYFRDPDAAQIALSHWPHK